MKLNKTNKVYSDFWLDDFDIDVNSNEFVSNNNVDTAKLVKLSMARKAVSNFVSILTGKNIPVVFNESNQNLTDGKVVLLSSDITDSKDFDPAVGLSLHEGSHILLTDFDVFKTIWQNIPRSLYNIAEPKGFSKTDVATFVKNVFNYVEDRYIDNYVYSSAPGYRGYYISLYDKYFHSDKVSEMLKSDMYRSLDIESYEVRLINLTNKNSDLNALPGLKSIAELLDLTNINRLATTSDRFNLALNIVKIIYSNVDVVTGDVIQVGANGNSVWSSDGGSVKNPNSSNSSDEPNDDADDVLGGGTSSVDSAASELSKENAEEKNSKSGFSKTKIKAIQKALEKQKIFINGEVKKKKVSIKDSKVLTQLEKSDVTLVNVGKLLSEEKPLTKGVDCIFVKNTTKELIFSDQFPCKYFCVFSKEPSTAMTSAVSRGIQLGTILGRRLKIRSEVNNTKYMRKSSGKIDKRIISELGFENENVFYKLDVDKYKKAFIHISVDASSSMNGSKWTNTMTTVTAICKATSMIDNIRVSVSMRSTSTTGSCLPFVAIVYDSQKDSFSKVKTLFPYLAAHGNTPEGLCFEAIMDSFKETTTEEDCYFLNFSDGEPTYSHVSTDRTLFYQGPDACKHTRRQVNMIRNKGYKILSYFISDRMEFRSHRDDTISNFKLMYGQDASYIDITNIIGIANTMNRMFLSKS